MTHILPFSSITPHFQSEVVQLRLKFCHLGLLSSEMCRVDLNRELGCYEVQFSYLCIYLLVGACCTLFHSEISGVNVEIKNV